MTATKPYWMLLSVHVLGYLRSRAEDFLVFCALNM